jgi:hypothetical protein
MSKLKYKGVDPNALIDIQISGQFYQYLVTSLTAFGDTKSPEEFKSALSAINDAGKSKDPYQRVIHIFAALIYEIETKAELQNKAKEYEIEVPEDTTTGS